MADSPDLDKSQRLKNILRPNRYKLDDRFVIRDGKTHPFAVVCPGGGYGMVCSFIARRLNEQGISAFIVYYRVRKKARYPNLQDDLARAVSEILDHGVGPGTGTAAEGWIERAASFWHEQA